MRVRMQVFLVVGRVAVPKFFFAPPRIAAVLAVDEDVEAIAVDAVDAVEGVAVEDAAEGAVEDAAGDVVDDVAYAVEGAERGAAGAAVVQSVCIVVRDFGVDGEFLAGGLVCAAEAHARVVADQVSFESCTVMDLAHRQIVHW